MSRQAANKQVPVERSIQLQIGPLNYLFRAYEALGGQVLAELAAALRTQTTPATDTDRIIHLLPNASPTPAWQTMLTTGPRVVETSPDQQGADHWTMQTNFINTVWSSDQTDEAFWTEVASPDIGRLRYHLPWNLIISDMVARGGGLMHGGLATFEDQGLLFLAPPGGGKTTTLASAPADWQIHSDDAALFWPGHGGSWLASALPSWTTLTSPQPQPAMSLDAEINICGIIVLQKADRVSLETLPPVSAIAPLYKGLSEYPLTVMSGLTFKDELFRAASRAANTLPCWQLGLPRGANIWPQLVELISEGH